MSNKKMHRCPELTSPGYFYHSLSLDYLETVQAGDKIVMQMVLSLPHANKFCPVEE